MKWEILAPLDRSGKYEGYPGELCQHALQNQAPYAVGRGAQPLPLARRCRCRAGNGYPHAVHLAPSPTKNRHMLRCVKW